MEGSSTKRRLSNGSGLLKICDEDGTEEDLNSVGTSVQEVSLYSFPKRGNSRRRSSIGGMKGKKSDVNPVEQARIMEMYKTVIQMSSENVRLTLMGFLTKYNQAEYLVKVKTFIQLIY